MPKYEVGQAVIMTNAYGRAGFTEGVVSRVARKYVSVGHGHNERKFDIETGSEPRGGYMGGAIYSLEAWAERERQNAGYVRLRELGFDSRQRSYSAATIAEVIAVLERGSSDAEQ